MALNGDVRFECRAHWQSGTHCEYSLVRFVHVLPCGQHASPENATAPTRPPHWPHAPVAHAAESWSASVLLPFGVHPLFKLTRSNVKPTTAHSATATTHFSLNGELRSHARRLVAPESRPLSLESSNPSIQLFARAELCSAITRREGVAPVTPCQDDLGEKLLRVSVW